MAHLGGDELVDDRRVTLPALDHQIGRDRAVGELTHPAEVSPTVRGQGLDHAHAAALGDGGGQFGPGDVRHRCLNDGVLDAEQRLDAVGHALILCQAAAGSMPGLALPASAH